MRISRNQAFWSASLAGSAVLGVSVILLTAGMRVPSQAGTPKAEEGDGDGSEATTQLVEVHTIRPKCDPSFTMSVKAPCSVTAYEWADLEAQVAGRVEYIRKAEGAPVTAGERLVEIAVPDLKDDIDEKACMVRQRVAEWESAVANEAIAQAAVAVAETSIDVALAEVQEAQATLDFRGSELARLKGLLLDKGTIQQVVDEHQRYCDAAVGGLAGARGHVEKAKAGILEAQAKLKAAKADVQLKKDIIEVAKRAHARAMSLAGYAKITAPFDGVVTRRSVNRGSFVQNATTAHTIPLLRIERRDIVTVVMKVPDTFAPFVHTGTEAVIHMSELPGQKIHGKVTRFSPTLDSDDKDHTLSVQVDLYNGTNAEYEKFHELEKAKKVPFDDLKEGPRPLAPMITGNAAEEFQRLYPGMYGEMRLVFRHLPKVFLIPSDAIVRRGGTPYLYLVKDGKVQIVTIEVQANDQKLAKVAIVERTAKGLFRHNLTGTEEVICAKRNELTDGEAVTAVPEEWQP